MRRRVNAVTAHQPQPSRYKSGMRFSAPFLSVGSSASSIAHAAHAVCPDGKERNSLLETPSATSFFLSSLPAFHQGLK